MLGLLPPGIDLGRGHRWRPTRRPSRATTTRAPGAMRIIEGAQTANRVLYEMTVAHELTHALEDQHFDFDEDAVAEGDDAGARLLRAGRGHRDRAHVPLRGRSASRPEEALGASLGVRVRAGPGRSLPPFLMAQLLFPYTAGEAFVDRLLEVGGGGWTVVDAALRFRPPASTEQVLHPETYLEVEQPDRVGRARRCAAGRCCERSHGGGVADRRGCSRGAGGTGAARGRRGLGRRRATRCSAAATSARSASAGAGTPPRDAREFAAALRAWAEDGLPESEPAGTDAWRGRDGVAVVREDGDAVGSRSRPTGPGPRARGGADAPATSLCARRAGSSAVRAAGS